MAIEKGLYAAPMGMEAESEGLEPDLEIENCRPRNGHARRRLS